MRNLLHVTMNGSMFVEHTSDSNMPYYIFDGGNNGRKWEPYMQIPSISFSGCMPSYKSTQNVRGIFPNIH